MNRDVRIKGFTLVEILMAITITALVLFTIYGIFTSVSRAKNRVEADSEGFREARVIFDRMGREIRSAYVRSDYAGSIFTGGVNAEGNPFLQFSTTATTPQSGLKAGLSVVGYEFREDPDAPDKKVLMRTETSSFEIVKGKNAMVRFATDLAGMKLRFYDKKGWHDQWQKGIPEIVEVTLTIRINGADVPFMSSFEVPTVQP